MSPFQLPSSPHFLAALSFLCAGCGASPSPKATSPSSESPSPSETRAPLEAAKVSYAMRGREDDFRRCFMQSMNSRGAVRFEFDIDSQGVVESSKLGFSDLNSPSVEDCLSTVLGETKFGERSSATHGSWTFVFRLTDPVAEEERDELLEESDEDMTAFRRMPESIGEIDAGTLDERIQVRYPLYAHCYRDSIKRRGESRGVVKFRLDINDAGELTALEDAGSILPDAYAVDCMAEAFYAIDYPEPTGGKVSIEYRLDFE